MDWVACVQTLARIIALCFFGKTVYSHSASCHPGVLMGTGEEDEDQGLRKTWIQAALQTSSCQIVLAIGWQSLNYTFYI